MSTTTMNSTSITSGLVRPRRQPQVRVEQQRQPIVHVAEHDGFAELMEQGLFRLLFVGFFMMAASFVAGFLL